jgi:acyl-CoA thioester hydrolase
MFSHKIKLRVRYGETDQMGVVYYGNYAQFFEVARVEALRNLGMSYRQLEEQNVILPVRHLEIDYKGSALYDEQIEIITKITEKPSAKIIFNHVVLNEKGEIITTGRVVLVFVNAHTRKPMRAPNYFLELFKPYFD